MSQMPTSSDYKGPDKGAHGQVNLKSRIAGTDKWNSDLYSVGVAQGVNPVFLKVIMAIESSGNLSAYNSTSRATGPFQILPYWYSHFDYSRMKTDVRYAIECACEVIKEKVSNSGKRDIYTVARYYYDANRGDSYGRQAVEMYEGLGYSRTDTVFDIPAKQGSGGGGNYSDPTGEAVDPSLPQSPIAGKAPSVEDDEYPAHRMAGNPFVLRIGDSQFFLPPEEIFIEKNTSIETTDVIRHQSPIMSKSGFSHRTIRIRLMFADTDQINGYPVEGPNGQTYYMDGLRALLAQFRKNPFLPIRNEWINYTHEIFNVAFRTISLETLDTIDNAIVAELVLEECTMEPYIHYPDDFYDRMFMYPVFRWWYQQLLHDDRTKAYSSTYLRPIENSDMNGELHFRVLDRELLEEKLKEVEDQQLGIYKLAKMKWADIDREFMTDWPIGEPIVSKVTIVQEKKLAPIRMDEKEINAYQDMGGMMSFVTLEMLCSREELEALNTMVSYIEELSRDYRHRFVSGFGKIGNEIVNLAGIYHFMPYGIVSHALNDVSAGDMFMVKLTLAAFDPTQKNHERVHGINHEVINATSYYDTILKPVIEHKTDRKHELIYETRVEKTLELLELYPDLELPTYDTLNKIISKINKLRKQKGYQPLPFEKYPKPPDAVFVDPDFYIAYPTIESVLSNFTLDNMGQRYLNAITTGSYADIASQDQELTFSGLTDMMHNEIIDNWQDEAHRNLREIKGNKNVDLTSAGQLRYIQAGTPWHWDGNPVMDPVEDSDALATAMCHDMYRYGKIGRLSRAFPTYLLLFVDEGMWLDGKRLWNNYYAYHAIKEINLVRDKNNPVDLAYITLSNKYGTFDHSERLTDPRSFDKPKGIWERAKDLWKDIFMSWTDKQISERTQLAEQIKLRQGARVHLRMGYSASAAHLPICFNGHIAEINDGPEIQMVCQGDGVELVNQALSFDPNATTAREGFINGPFDGFGGREARNIFKHILGRRNSDYWFQTSDKWNFFYNYESKYGIEHFGTVESKASDGFIGTVLDHAAYWVQGIWDPLQYNSDDGIAVNVYEVMKNVYRGLEKASTDETLLWDGEDNIELSVYNKTPWDIFQTLARFTPEFICAVHPHGFRSTLFFGMPHWMLKYGYRMKKDLGIAGGGSDENNYKNYVELTKPYQQMHVINSSVDIIHNDIRASSEKLVHIAVGGYVKGSGQDVATAWAVYADRSIRKSVQKTMLVDTGVSQNYWGPEWLYNVLGQATVGQLLNGLGDTVELIADGFGFVGDKLNWDWAQELSKEMNNKVEWYREHVDPEAMFDAGAKTARDVSIGELQYRFMEMYQGELITFGKPEIKPWDFFYLADTHRQIAGTAQVGKITHMMSMEQGFISSIKPDLCVTRSDHYQRNAYMQLAILTGIGVSQWLLRKLLASNFAKVLARLTMKKMVVAPFKAIGKVGRTTGKVFKHTPKTIAIGWDKVKNGNFKIGDIDLKASGGKLLKRASVAVRGNIVTGLLLGFLTLQAERLIKKELMFNNCIYIYPLWKHGKPFVAGIHGAKYIIPNYIEPEYVPEDLNSLKNLPPGAVGSGGLPSSGGVMHPVPDTRGVSSWYGMRSGGMHYGVDLYSRGHGGPIHGHLETKIRSIADGEVIFRGVSDSAGKWVQIRHNIGGQDYVSIYMHLHNVYVGKGDRVKMGDVIGIMGTTGRSTGVHLHLEIAKGKTRNKPSNLIDPKGFFEQFGINLNNP